MLARIVDIALAVAAVSTLIVVHELGHLFAAKAVGMRVEAFAIGFWKKLFGFRIGETEYRLCLVPLGGYVQVSGEGAAQGKGEPHEFLSKTPGQRAIFVLGGVTMNLVLALTLFIIAFSIGVPFTVAEVGTTIPGQPAWKAGLKPGDRIVAVEGTRNPTFEDLTRAVALGGSESVNLEVERNGHILSFNVTPRYDESAGMRLIGIAPPVEPVVSALVNAEGENGVGPASEAGLREGDRIEAVNGKPVHTANELDTELLNFPPGKQVDLTVERDGQSLPVRLRLAPVPQKGIGVSGQSATIEGLEGGGEAERLGLKEGDRIAAVNGKPIGSGIEFSEIIRSQPGKIDLTVVRGGADLSFQTVIPDPAALARFQGSLVFETGPKMAWVKEGGPAWNAGLRPGDTLVSVGGHEVHTWSDILRQGARAGDEEREIQWERAGELVTANVTPTEDLTLPVPDPGFVCETLKTTDRRYGPLMAVRKGVVNTGRTLSEVVLMVRGFATHEVSPREMRGIVSIAVVSYRAAQQGLGMLLYLTAVISGALAFLNVLPIPVLDGGHLLFIFLEKVRGRRLGERALLLSNAVGLALLLMLVVYVTWNDIMRFIPSH